MHSKRVLTFIGVGTLLVLSVVSGCSRGGDRTPFVGNWDGPDAMVQTQFFADGTFVQGGGGSSVAGKYQIEERGAVKYLKMDSKIKALIYEIVDISPNLIRLKEGDDIAHYLARKNTP
jgi:hypothetical protein